MCSEAVLLKPGSKAEREVSREVLLNLKAAIAANKHDASYVIEDLHALLEISSNIRNDFVGTFKALPNWISEELALSSKNHSMQDLDELITIYSQHSDEIYEIVSSEMSVALPATYEKFINLLILRPDTWATESFDKMAIKLRPKYDAINTKNGIYEETQNLTNSLAKTFIKSKQLKTTTLKSLKQLFQALKKSDSKQVTDLRTVSIQQLSELNANMVEYMGAIKQPKVINILHRLSAIHNDLRAMMLETFHDELKHLKAVNNLQNAAAENSTGQNFIPAQIQKIKLGYKTWIKNPTFLLGMFILLLLLYFLVRKGTHILSKNLYYRMRTRKY